MKPLLIFLCIIISLHSYSLYAQTPVIEWQKCYGGNNGDYAWSIEQTSDGGYITAGYTEGPDNGDIMGYHGNIVVGDLWIVKSASDGTIQWQKCLGGAYQETGAVIHQTADGGYIVAGSSASVDCSITGNHGGLDYWIVKLNSKGDIVWQKMAGGSKNEYAYGLAIANDGGYFVSGFTESSDGDVTINHGVRDFWIIKLDASGNLIWQKSLGGDQDDEAFSVQATSDGGCVAAGYTQSANGDVTGFHGKSDLWIVKLDNTGNLQWQKALGGSGSEGAWSIQVTKDGGYIAAGSSNSNDGDVSGNHMAFGPGDLDFWVVKIDNAGNLQWQKCYGGSFNEIAYFIQNTPDGGYVLTGSAESSDGDLTCHASGGITDLWTIKINGTGGLQWQKNMGGNYYDEGHCVQALNDGSFIIAGSTCSTDISGYHAPTNNGSCGDFWVIKLSAPSATAPSPVVTINPASGIVCANTNAMLTASASYAGESPSYQWTRNGINVGANSSTYSTSGFANNDIIKCTVTSGGQCENSTATGSGALTIQLNNTSVNPQIVINADNTVICPCTSISFKATVSNIGVSPVYSWKVNNTNVGNNSNIFISNTLNAGDVVTCIYSDNASCLANGPVTSNAIAISQATNQSPSITITTASTTSCTNSTIIFVANAVNAGVNPSYQWKVNGVNVGTNNDSLSITTLKNGDVVSCSINSDPAFVCVSASSASSNNIVVSISDKLIPSVTISASSDIVCTGNVITFTAEPSNAGTNPSYQWQVNGINAGTNNTSFSTSSLLSGDLVSCIISADPDFPCINSTPVSSNNISVTVINGTNPSLSVTASDNDICQGKIVTFTANAQNAGTDPLYSWSINNQPTGFNSTTLNANNLKNGDIVFCTLTPGSAACSKQPISSSPVIMIINDTPVVEIHPADTLITSGSTVTFSVSSSQDINTYNWTPPDKLQSPLSLSPTTIALFDNTVYTLTVTGMNGCAASSNATVRIFTKLIMPNAFTPNEDGVNDVFRIPQNSLLSLIEFSVYDRWGNKVFSTQDPGKGWDGYFNGRKADEGTYVYFIKGVTNNGNVNMKGTVLLVR